MHLLAPFVLVVLALYGPSLWVQWVLRRYSRDLPGCQWTGGELAEHLLLRQGIEGVTVETTDRGDHYDKDERAVRLTREKFHGRSLTALTVAAHEVGHAIQHASGYRPLALRHRVVEQAQQLQKMLPWVVGALVLLAIVIRIPAFVALVTLLFLASLAVQTVAHIVTLPVEWNASFSRALPLLEDTGVIHPKDAPAARRILTAAALTYVSASLASMLRLGRWLRGMRI